MQKQIYSMRQIFCGFERQHQMIVEAAKKFIRSPEPGAFVVGGTNLTGKTSLIKRIRQQSGLEEFNYHSQDTHSRPNGYYVVQNVGFSDGLTGRPQMITPNELFDSPGTFKSLPEALNRGIRIIFLDEIWAGHGQAITLVADELVRKRGCKVIFDVVSSGAGREFCDSKANNDFICREIPPLFRPGELHLYPLAFDKKALHEGMIHLAATHDSRQFEANIAGFFSRDCTDQLVEAARRGYLTRELNNLLATPNFGRGERLR